MIMRRFEIILILVCLLAGSAARAVQPDEIMSDPALEARARALSAELRCMVCQNQSIDDSEASLARDLRLIVRERLKAGDNEHAIRRYLVARYGDFILLKPPFDAETWLLWLTPALAAVLGSLAIWRMTSGRGAQAVAPLAPAESERLAEILSREE
jgi:cytochrome c-type biogenesis protein CcmH